MSEYPQMYEAVETFLRAAGCDIPLDHVSEFTVTPGELVVTEQLTNDQGEKYVWGGPGDPRAAERPAEMVNMLAIKTRRYPITVYRGGLEGHPSQKSILDEA